MNTNNKPANEKLSIKFVLRALSYKNFRLFFGGQIVSLVGTWMQMVAMSWLVYSMTSSPFILAVIGFASQIPSFFMAPFAGVLIDRWSRHKVIIATQVLSMLQAFLLAYLVFTDQITVTILIVLNVVLGIINGFDNPARQAFVVDLVEKREDLGNAIALNSSSFNAARLIGPGIAGILIGWVGEGMCFLLNGVTYIAVIAALFAMNISEKERKPSDKKIFQDMKDGFNYSFGFPPIRDLLLLLGVISLFGMPYAILMPIYAKDIFNGDATTLGWLMSSIGVGALLGALYLASRRSVVGLGKVLAATSGTFGAGIIVFSFSTNFILSMIMLVICGLSMMLLLASNNTILQTLVEDDKRGKVMSIYIMIFMGVVPISSLFAGSLAETIGAPETLAIGGAVCILVSLIFARRLPHLKAIVRPIYIRMGIIPQVASAIDTSENSDTKK